METNLTKVLLGKKIKSLRKSKGWTQEILSERLGINAKSVLRIENGKTFPTIQNLEKLSQIFEIEISELFNNDYLNNSEVLMDSIYKIIPTLDKAQIRSLYIFLTAIK